MTPPNQKVVQRKYVRNKKGKKLKGSGGCEVGVTFFVRLLKRERKAR